MINFYTFSDYYMEFAYHFRTWQMSDNNTEWLGKYGD